MNLTAVYKYIASSLGTAVCTFSPNKVFQKRYCKRIDFKDGLLSDPAIKDYFFANADAHFPIISVINKGVTYGLITSDIGYFLVGPVYTNPSYGIKYCYEQAECSPEFLSSLTVCSIMKFIAGLLLIHNLINDDELSELDCFNRNTESPVDDEKVLKNTTSTVFYNRESSTKHNPYDQEYRMMASIEKGDMEWLKTCIEEEYDGTLGTASKDPVRNGKILAMSVITLSSRAAIRGGLHPEIAYSLCDSYNQYIDELTNMLKLQSFVENAELTFCRLVKETKNSRQSDAARDMIPVIESCKNYVFAHLHSKLTVQEIADSLCVHPNYLTSLFKKQEGISLYQYILKQKIDLAKNLLTYSEYSFIDIACYLGFTSQSHLGKQFKKSTGYTMNEYRNQFGKKNYF